MGAHGSTRHQQGRVWYQNACTHTRGSVTPPQSILWVETQQHGGRGGRRDQVRPDLGVRREYATPYLCVCYMTQLRAPQFPSLENGHNMVLERQFSTPNSVVPAAPTGASLETHGQWGCHCDGGAVHLGAALLNIPQRAGFPTAQVPNVPPCPHPMKDPCSV